MEVQNAQPQVQTEQPAEAAPQAPASPLPPVDEVPSEIAAVEPAQSEVPTIEEPVVEDRLAFNCKTCGGEGLIGDPAGQHERCTACDGTGKQ